jgi:hypothetical protein
MAWTEWRKIAQGREWSSDEFDHDGPACYELGIRTPKGRNVTPVYVGETANEQRRIRLYASGNSHLEGEIGRALRVGCTLLYRGQAKPSKREAKRMQDRLLDRYDYPWNTQSNV